MIVDHAKTVEIAVAATTVVVVALVNHANSVNHVAMHLLKCHSKQSSIPNFVTNLAILALIPAAKTVAIAAHVAVAKTNNVLF
jgi:hypothetical protein